ncbi:WHG domain-containing protein [Leucobacter sp. CSA2]|uniref:WHG domain-containing protein n=1 Tax=Leucobacter edaphi TaxID=2796472 RepID=A0A934QDC8_9MICO|nr:TetR/AcrR family transcriptional regulator [Leucobacter edaphi]MBK0421134.1 WHG domain-containing protein [Leucobacter edaphi]
MAAPDKTSLDAIVLAAREILEADGIDGLTMQSIAQRVGVRAPSLYKRVRNRDELIRLVNEAGMAELEDRFRGSEDARALAARFRAFAHERPAAFRLMMTPGTVNPDVDQDLLARASEEVLRHAGTLAGEAEALEAARTLTAWTTGFIAMELGGSFNLGGDVERAWEYGLAAVIDGIASRGRAAESGR